MFWVCVEGFLGIWYTLIDRELIHIAATASRAKLNIKLYSINQHDVNMPCLGGHQNGRLFSPWFAICKCASANCYVECVLMSHCPSIPPSGQLNSGHIWLLKYPLKGASGAHFGRLNMLWDFCNLRVKKVFRYIIKSRILVYVVMNSWFHNSLVLTFHCYYHLFHIFPSA